MGHDTGSTRGLFSSTRGSMASQAPNVAHAAKVTKSQPKPKSAGFLCFLGKIFHRHRKAPSTAEDGDDAEFAMRQRSRRDDSPLDLPGDAMRLVAARECAHGASPGRSCSESYLPRARELAEERPITEPTTPSDCRSAIGSLDLGPRLGGCNTNVVYKGMLNGSPVAVRLVRHAKVYTSACEPLEGYLQANVHHPNLVRILGLRTRPMGGRRLSGHRPSDVSNGDSVSSFPRQSASSDVFSDMARHLPAKHRHSLGPDEEMETWVVMEYCDRGSLAQGLATGLCWKDVDPKFRIVNFRTVLRIALEVAKAMAHLHSCGIVHGDLKPENVLLQSKRRPSKGFTCKVGDFELSRLTNRVSILETFSIGTLSHQPPEMLQKGLLTPEADVFSFGMVLWEMVAGQVPFKGKPPAVIQMSIVNGYRPRVPPSWPAWYGQLVRSCWSHDRRKRPDFETVVQHLQLVMANMKAAQRQSLDQFRSRKSSVEECEKYRDAEAQTEPLSPGKGEPDAIFGGVGAPEVVSTQWSDISIGSRIGGQNLCHSPSSLRDSSFESLKLCVNGKRSLERNSGSSSSSAPTPAPCPFHFGTPRISATMQSSAKLSAEHAPAVRGSSRACDIFVPRPSSRSGSTSLDCRSLPPVEEERSSRTTPRRARPTSAGHAFVTARSSRPRLSTVSEPWNGRHSGRHRNRQPGFSFPMAKYPVARGSKESLAGQKMEHCGTGESVPEEEYYWECRRFCSSSSFDTSRSSSSSERRRRGGRAGASQPPPPQLRVRIFGDYGRPTLPVQPVLTRRQPVVVAHSSACLSSPKGRAGGPASGGMEAEWADGGLAEDRASSRASKGDPIVVIASR